jgi:hypothetical protein
MVAKELTSERAAYLQVMADFRQVDLPPEFLKSAHLDLYFHHGEGHGLILPRRVLYTSTPNGDNLWVSPVNPQIEEHSLNWRQLIPDIEGDFRLESLSAEISDEVLAFTRALRAEWAAIRSSKI